MVSITDEYRNYILETTKPMDLDNDDYFFVIHFKYDNTR